MATRRKSANEIEAGDESKLAELGYAQELKRDWSVLHNFGVSFSIISVITGITTLFRFVRLFLKHGHATDVSLDIPST